ncbi:MAG: ribonuclease HII [Candidatus Paceibacterota bacterium]
MVAKKRKYIIGIDEVGRGPLAGEVTVAAILLQKNFRFTKPNFQKKLKLRDSKKLSPKQREIWFEYIKEELCLGYAVASVSPKKIDRINISNAANLAAVKAFESLIKKTKIKIENCEVCLDGGLYLKTTNNKLQTAKYKQRTIIRGDEKIPAISLASIVAKVIRDKKMEKSHKKYPQYGFKNHKGYGTKEHFRAIKKHGPSKIHRLTFLKKMR